MTQLAMAAQNEEAGGRLVSVDGRTLPLRGVSLKADARGGVARVVLEQRFENVWDEPLSVTYLMPLPADGAVSGYAFTIGARRVVGEVDKKQRARERFEQAILNGQTAGIVDQERSSLFTQELGNVPAHTVVVAELTIDQRLTWLDEGAWEWRFPTAAGPRFTGGRVADAARTEIAVADGPLPVAMHLALDIRDAVSAGGRPESPMHALHARALGGRWQVAFGSDGGVALDRDVVVRWPVTAPKVGLSVDVGRPASAQRAYGLMTIVPPAGKPRGRRRDLSLLLDTSGSMGGEPLRQSVRTCMALVETLSDDDSLEMIEFSSSARRWKSRPVSATQSHKKDACKWLQKLEAGGSTEMVDAVLAAIRPLSSEAQRQVVLLTDGYIGFETAVVQAVSQGLPAGSRLHVIGVGSAVNRSLTGPAARAGRGIEVVMAPGEDPERGVKRLLARTSSPLVTDLELDGTALLAAPSRLPDLYAGSPALCAVELKPEGGTLIVRGRTVDGAYEERVEIKACGAGEGAIAAAALYARERVEDAELRLAAGGEQTEIDAEIERLGLAFQISTRLTTWVAVSAEIAVDPSSPTRREEIPQQLPHGLAVEGFGLRPALSSAPHSTVMRSSAVAYGALGAASGGAPPSPPSAAAPAPQAPGGMSKRAKTASVDDELTKEARAAFEPTRDEEAFDAPSTQAGAPAPIVPASPARARSLRRRKAVLRLHKGRKIVLELRLEESEAWAPSDGKLTLADGSVIAVSFGPATTKAGTYGAGQVVRIEIDLPHEVGAPSLLTVGDMEIDIA